MNACYRGVEKTCGEDSLAGEWVWEAGIQLIEFKKHSIETIGSCMKRMIGQCQGNKQCVEKQAKSFRENEYKMMKTMGRIKI